MHFRPDTKAIYLVSYHPLFTPQAVAEDGDFALDIEEAVETPQPTPEELHILREIGDPERVFLR